VRISRDLRVNHEIRAREVRLVDEQGQQLGVVPLREALRIAADRGLDLVEVAPQATPVVCRIMDYGRFKYEQEKREREARRRQHIVEVKELVLKTYNIDPHDLETVARKGERLLRAGDKLKLTMRFRGREIVHADLGREVFDRLVQMLAPVAQVESEPRLEGRTLMMTLTPRPEVQRAAQEGRRQAAARAEAEAVAGEQAPST
jgi:translation initiation factor IF-3